MFNVPSLPSVSREEPENEWLYEDELFRDEFPAVYELLARIRVNGGNRMPSRISVYGEPGKLCLCIRDPYSNQVLFHAAESFAEALEGVESRLQAGTKDWRPNKASRR